MCEKESFMREAIKLSLDNIDHDGGPFGAVIVKDGKIIARGANRVTASVDPTAHAEVNAILQGAERGIPKGFTVYVTHFPCLNCTKQLLQVGCKRVVYINQYRIDDYARYLYSEKKVELVHLPIEKVKEAISETDLI